MNTSNVFTRRPLLGPALIVFVVALFARWLSWPGLATHDTIFITREAIEGQYTTYHPLLNALLVRFLAVPFESFWLYSTLQIALCATLFIRSIHLATSHLGKRWPVFVAIAIWGLAAHTVLYLGMIWKDVPIAYCLCFVAALAYRLRTTPEIRVGMLDAVLLGTSLFLCVGLRHGMAFNLVLIPLLLGYRRFMRDRRLWGACAIAVAGLLGITIASHTSLVRNDQAHFLKLKISAVSQPFLAVVSNANGYLSDDYGYDGALAARVFGKDYAKEYSPDYFRNQVVLESEADLSAAYRAIVRRTPRLCLMNTSLCLSGRVQMMLGTLQPSTKFGGMTFYDLGALPNCETAYGMGPDQCDVLRRYESSEKSSSALVALNRMNAQLVERKSTIGSLYLWNLLPALVLILAILALLTPRSPVWLLAGFFAIEMALPFATAMANDFRYYYFLFPFFAIFAPVCLAEFRKHSTIWPASARGSYK